LVPAGLARVLLLLLVVELLAPPIRMTGIATPCVVG
jgi:hypothetical protein